MMNSRFSDVSKSITLKNCLSRNTFYQLTGMIQNVKELVDDIF